MNHSPSRRELRDWLQHFRLKDAWALIRGRELLPRTAATTVAIGFAIGSFPMYGIHLLVCSLVCIPLRLNLLLCYAAAHISVPFLAPFLFGAQYLLGKRVLDGSWPLFSRFELPANLPQLMRDIALPLVLGYLLLLPFLCGLGWALTYGFMRLKQARS